MTSRLGPIFLATLLTGCRAFGGSGADPNESDAGYIGIARNAPQVQAFYARYGGAAESVDRSGRLAVDFRASTARLRAPARRLAEFSHACYHRSPFQPWPTRQGETL